MCGVLYPQSGCTGIDINRFLIGRITLCEREDAGLYMLGYAGVLRFVHSRASVHLGFCAGQTSKDEFIIHTLDQEITIYS